MKYVVCLFKGCNGCCVSCCIVRRGAVGARVWECFVMTALWIAMSVSFCLPHAVEMSVLLCVEVCVRVMRCCECEFWV